MINKQIKSVTQFKQELNRLSSTSIIDLSDWSDKLYVKDVEEAKSKRIRVMKINKFGMIDGVRFKGGDGVEYNKPMNSYPISSLEAILEFLEERKDLL